MRVRWCMLFLLAGLAFLPGCLDEIIQGIINIDPTDGPVALPDGGTGFEGELPSQLTLLSLKPDHGPFVGGSEVVLSGSGFTKGVAVHIGGKAVQSTQVTLLSPVTLKIITPAGKVGKADVKLTRGAETTKLAGGFTYDPLYLDPSTGPTAGQTLVTLHGLGTSFKKGMTLLLGGQAMTEVEVLSTSSLRAKTPPGEAGPADLTAGTLTVKGAYTYYQTSSSKAGGMGGGSIKGTLTVSVLDWLTRKVVASARVVAQNGRNFTKTALTDAKGACVFSGTDVTGPVVVTVGKTGYETTTLGPFDARDVTVLLLPIPNPQPGALPPGQMAAYIQGYILFGGVTGLGTSTWKLVPEPKSGQSKRAYVYTSQPYMSWGPPGASSSATIDYTNTGAKAWPYYFFSRTGSLAVYAVAGLYTTATATFEPYAMGVTRGVVVGPGDVVDADVWITIPLTEKVTVKLADLPTGVTRHQVRLAVDLGADGLIMREDTEVTGDGILPEKTFGRLPPFNCTGLTDATYAVDVLLDTGSAVGLPLSRATETLVQPTAGVILVDRFLGVPEQVKPQAGGVLQGNTLAFSQGGSPASLAVTVITQTDETPVWRVMSPGTTTLLKLPDPKALGLPAWPAGTKVWLQYLAHLPGSYTFDSFTYQHLSSRYWDRWSMGQLSFTVP